MSNFKQEYQDLENRILAALRSKIENSKIRSKHVDSNCINVNMFGYTELVIINNSLTFLGSLGHHYSLWCDCDINDLIDILE